MEQADIILTRGIINPWHWKSLFVEGKKKHKIREHSGLFIERAKMKNFHLTNFSFFSFAFIYCTKERVWAMEIKIAQYFSFLTDFFFFSCICDFIKRTLSNVISKLRIEQLSSRDESQSRKEIIQFLLQSLVTVQ